MMPHSNWHWIAVLAVVFGGVALFLAALAGFAQQDRPETEPDHTRSASKVTIWQNIDKVPNVATFCAAGRGWITTLNSDGGHRGEVQRFFEMDPLCNDGSETALDGIREG